MRRAFATAFDSEKRREEKRREEKRREENGREENRREEKRREQKRRSFFFLLCKTSPNSIKAEKNTGLSKAINKEQQHKISSY